MGRGLASVALLFACLLLLALTPAMADQNTRLEDPDGLLAPQASGIQITRYEIVADEPVVGSSVAVRVVLEAPSDALGRAGLTVVMEHDGRAVDAETHAPLTLQADRPVLLEVFWDPPAPGTYTLIPVVDITAGEDIPLPPRTLTVHEQGPSAHGDPDSVQERIHPQLAPGTILWTLALASLALFSWRVRDR